MHLVIRTICDAVPTIRHARILFDLVADRLGDALARGGTLYRREGELAIPWHVLRLDAPAGAPRRHGPGAIEIWDGIDHATVQYDEDGAWESVGWSGELERHEDFVHAMRSGRDNPLELLAERVAAMDVARHGPGRVFADAEDPLGAWYDALAGLREACVRGRVPGTARWAAARATEITHGTTRDAALERWSAPARPEAIVSFPPLPPPDPILWGRWARLLSPCGATSHALVRHHEDGFLLIGEHLLAEWSPLSIQAAVEGQERRNLHDLAPPAGKRDKPVAITYVLDEDGLVPLHIHHGPLDFAGVDEHFRDRILHVRRAPRAAARRR